ncbi:unnamed protein product [Pedinophyceae sp. YPF-701]|nr:unnamed protein product [Pedinophyceae sp. YPF-701]
MFGSSVMLGQSLAARPATVSQRRTLPITAGLVGPGKKWERLPVTKNGKPVKQKLHVKTGDTVVVISGKDKQKVGEVTKVYPKTGKIVVQDVNIVTKHEKPVREGETGQIVKREAPIHSSNVMHWSKEKEVRSRIGYKEEGGKKVRYLKKTGEVLA